MRTTRVFNSDNSQAVRLPRQFRIDAATGDIVLSTRTVEGEGGWAEFFALRDKTRLPADFMIERPMNTLEAAPDPFAVSPVIPPGGRSVKVSRKPAKKR